MARTTFIRGPVQLPVRAGGVRRTPAAACAACILTGRRGLMCSRVACAPARHRHLLLGAAGIGLLWLLVYGGFVLAIG